MTKTLNVYNRMAQDYADFTQDYAPTGLREFIDAVPTGGNVLDLGCGPGHHSAIMADAGLTVLAVDGSAEMVALARQHPNVTARQAMFDDIPDLDPVAGIWASFSLLHAPRTDLPRHLTALKAILKSNGAFGIGMKLGTGEETDDLGRFYCYYDADELTNLLITAGFTVTATHFGRDAGLSGQMSDWIVNNAHG